MIGEFRSRSESGNCRSFRRMGELLISTYVATDVIIGFYSSEGLEARVPEGFGYCSDRADS